MSEALLEQITFDGYGIRYILNGCGLGWLALDRLGTCEMLLE